ncbi:hypothetical protein [Flavobacterium sp.]|uniref:hypothetical protein n=1 Tax=Flavobacterium sp. TaxID=239 RepID=UPI00286CC65C|nr:hypothetical protein [Flavobacterium sp.]
MKKFAVIVFFLVGQYLLAQTTVNQYQYVIVPTQFKFTTQEDQYRLNTLTKLLLEKYGFKVYFDTDVLPEALKDSRCDKLYADVVSSGSFIITKIQVTLKDCQNNLIYQSAIGKSKEKEYKAAYTLALREAFQSFETLHYQYTPTKSNAKIATPNNEKAIVSESFDDFNNNELLYAQTISNGYQLVDTTPKIIMKIFKTSNPTTFSAIKGTIQGVLISKDNQWFFEYYQEEKLISEKVNVKF